MWTRPRPGGAVSSRACGASCPSPVPLRKVARRPGRGKAGRPRRWRGAPAPARPAAAAECGVCRQRHAVTGSQDSLDTTRPLRSRTVVTCRLRPCRRSGLRRSGLDVHMQISQSRVSCFEVLNLCPPVDTILLIRGTFLPFAWCFVCVASSGERTGSPTAGRNRRDARSRAGNSALPSCVSMCLSRGQ